MAIMRYYHVAHESFAAGDDLLCRNRLLDEGRAPPWAWDDADEGYDGDIVCLYETEDEAREHRNYYCSPESRILAVDLDIEDGCALYPSFEVALLTNAEGYAALPEYIPGEYITIID